MHLALFDLDHTLLDGDSNSLWLAYLVAAGQLPADVLQRQAAEYARYEAGSLDIGAYLAFHLSLLSTRPLAEWRGWRDRFVAEAIAPRISRTAFASVDAHRPRGDRLAIVTATHDFLAAGIAELFGPLALIAPRAEIVGDRLSGRIVGEISFGPRKPAAVEAWLAGQGLSLAGFAQVHAYSDSHNDLPLLELATLPCAVNADPALTAHAHRLGWPVQQWRAWPPSAQDDAGGDGEHDRAGDPLDAAQMAVEPGQ